VSREDATAPPDEGATPAEEGAEEFNCPPCPCCGRPAPFEGWLCGRCRDEKLERERRGPAELMTEIRGAARLYGFEVLDPTTAPLVCYACGVTPMKRSGACAECEKKRADADLLAAIERAWHTVEEWNWGTDLRKAEIFDVVSDRDAVAAVRRISVLPAIPRTVTFYGPTGAGKTTLACALLREWIRRSYAKDATPEDIRNARRARFAAAHKIVGERAETELGKRVTSLEQCLKASYLVIDEVGRGKDTHGLIFEIVSERHANKRPTIIATPALGTEAEVKRMGALGAARAELGRLIDGGMARRVFDDAEHVVHVRKAGATA